MLGSVRPGKPADLVLLEGDPLDVTDLAPRVRAVYQDGRLVHGAADDPTGIHAGRTGAGAGPG